LSENFQDKSYDSHSEWYNKQYPDKEAKLKHIEKRFNRGTIDEWLHGRKYDMLLPFFGTGNFLTIGDGVGVDAGNLKRRGFKVMASDISGMFLPLTKEAGYIDDFCIQNAEKIDLPDNAYDYVMCKEAYHHFPRPAIALYEMIRVAKKAVILIEPADPVLKMPLLMAMNNRLSTNKLKKIWKNKYSYETVGNFVYKISEREIEKQAAGINLPAVAFKGIHEDFFKPGYEKLQANDSISEFKAVKKKIKKLNRFSKFHILPYGSMCAVIFKTEPDKELKEKLIKNGYKVNLIPKNPYI